MADPKAEMTKVLLEHGADVDARDSALNTPLHLAAWNGNAEAAKLLLESGAKIDAAGKFGHTPLKTAQMESSQDHDGRAAAFLKDYEGNDMDPLGEIVIGLIDLIGTCLAELTIAVIGRPR